MYCPKTYPKVLLLVAAKRLNEASPNNLSAGALRDLYARTA